MALRDWKTCRRVLCCVLVSLAGAALADEKRRGLESGETVQLTTAMLVTFANGATSRGHEFQHVLQVGQTLADAMDGVPFSFGVAGGTSGCSSESGTFAPEVMARRFPIVWTADAKLIEASTDHLLLDVSWKRLERAPDGSVVEAATDQIERLSIGEGDRVLLDFARTRRSSCFRNAAIEITAEIQEDQALAGRQIGYDLWLVHEKTGVRVASERATLTGGQGDEVPFAFPKQRLASTVRAQAPENRLQVYVSGDLRGRLRGDGSVELSLGTFRSLAYVTAEEANDGVISEVGNKTIRVRPGEPVRVELPGAPRVNAGDGRTSAMATDLAGHTFALIVTAKPL